ncbi:response regulator transcription factor [Nitratiruptor sp. YY09-18]|uniref:response regulator transcription factor n=1 Tax=Nitratiruptor sp. YY09-18 TaxID=2724901 RepID=UPI001915BDAA|nr:response regulator [Nitratiruptor sp. YY09-18]BCD68512.1 hypothetical protein NitYY0918_C1429 [Nitratiruptor sp. YY09-18]
MKKVLIVEDESLVALEIKSTLRQYGIESCYISDSVEEAIEIAKKCSPDVVLLDIYLAGPKSGIEGCKEFKELGIPVIFLTAYSDEKSMSGALECEPHAYLIKPFRRAELYAAVKMATKHKKGEQEVINICGNILYDPRKNMIIRDNKEIILTGKEKSLLDLLLKNRGRVVQFPTIEYTLWPDEPISESTRRSLIHRLRQKISKECIRTITGIGVILD